jgi:hypothetical protein
MSDLERIEDRLDSLISLLRIAFKDEIDRERASIAADPVSKAVLDAASDWVQAGKLKSQVVRVTHQSEPTVKRRISELVAAGALRREGRGGRVAYRSSGLLG